MFWLLTNRMLLKMISIVSTLILVRLLTPADFGLVALAMSFYALVQLFSSFGFEATLIQVKDATDGHYSTVWTIRFLVSVIMCILTFLAAPYVVEFYNDSALLVLVRLISFLFILNSLVNPGMIRFIKEMDLELFLELHLMKSSLLRDGTKQSMGSQMLLQWYMTLITN